MKSREGYTEEFARFQASTAVTPRADLSARIRAEVARDLQPSLVAVFTKVLGIHVVAAVATLSICPQFGIKLGAEGMGLMHYFMGLGEMGCRAACGFFFMALSLGLSAALLRAPEVRQLRRKWWIESLFLILASLGFFVMIAPEEVLGLLAVGWIAGGMMGSWIALEAIWKLRTLRMARVGAT